MHNRTHNAYIQTVPLASKGTSHYGWGGEGTRRIFGGDRMVFKGTEGEPTEYIGVNIKHLVPINCQ